MENLRQSLLTKRLRNGRPNSEDPGKIHPIPEGIDPPLSFSQERLWLIDQLEPKSAAYNIPILLRIQGPLDAASLETALNEICRRHDVLRTTFTVKDDRPIQVISSHQTVHLPVRNLGRAAAVKQRAAGYRIAAGLLHEPFDLSKGPLLRQELIRFSESEYVLVLVVHHIVFDGWSSGVFLRELSALYESYASGGESPLRELPVQYADFAFWQRERLQGSVLESQLQYWRRALEGDMPVLDLPADHSRKPVQTYRGARIPFALPENLAKSLNVLAKRHNATLFMVLLAAFQTLLYRYTGQRDIAVGSPIANRTRAEIEGLIGFFLNTLVLRSKPSGSMKFTELLQTVRELTLQAYAHQDIPFEKLLEELQPSRTLSHSPLFQVMFVLQNVPQVEVTFSNLKISAVPLDSGLTKFDLNLHMVETERGISGVMHFRRDLFEAETVARMVGRFHKLLEGIASNPERRLMDIPLLTQRDQAEYRAKRLLRPTKAFVRFADRDIESSIVERFEAQVDKHASRIAVHAVGGRWTYAELNRRANTVAGGILERSASARAAAAGEDVPRAALLFEQDAPMLSAILGVLKAGMAYVPLDPSFPLPRLAAILERSRARMLVTNGGSLSVAARLRERCGIEILDIDAHSNGRFTSNPRVSISPSATAYILFTSGSTGDPKGVIQNHRNILHFIRTYTNNLHIDSSDRLSLLSSYRFDAAVMDIYGALLNGAELCICDIRGEGLLNLRERICRDRITIYHSTPTVYRYFVEALSELTHFPDMRLIVLGGEPVYRRDVEMYKRYFPEDCLFVNGMGPTESTVALQFFADRKTRLLGNDVPLGFAVEETQAYLLADQRRPEICGEIAIRSPFVSPGYLDYPEQTKRAFIPDPYAPDRRIYLTGDIGRLLPNGDVIYIGRKDSQVKIRGHRVELGEIEAALSAYNAVQKAVVVSRDAEAGGKVIVAYVVPVPGVKVEIRDIRIFLRHRLPDYMLPSAVVFLDHLPVTPNGKVDERALPIPAFPTASEDRYVPPSNPVEKKVADCWAAVLGVEKVGINENFFDLGGNSMSATRLIARLRSEFRLKLPLRAIFRDSTVVGLAQSIRCDESTGSYRYVEEESRWISLVPMQPKGTRTPFFLVAGAHAEEEQFLRYLSHMIPSLGMDQPVYGFKPRGLDGRLKAHRSVEEMACDYLAELRQFQKDGPYLLGGECVGGIVAYEMAQQLLAQGSEVGLLVLLDTPKPTPLAAFRSRSRYMLRRIIRIRAHLLYAYRSGYTGGIRYLLYLAMKKARHFLPKTQSDLVQRKIRAVEGAYSRILLRYEPKKYPGRLTLVVNRKQHARNPALGWRSLAAGGLRVHVIPGNHVTRLTVHGRLVAEKLLGCLDEARKGRSS